MNNFTKMNKLQKIAYNKILCQHNENRVKDLIEFQDSGAVTLSIFSASWNNFKQKNNYSQSVYVISDDGWHDFVLEKSLNDEQVKAFGL